MVKSLVIFGTFVVVCKGARDLISAQSRFLIQSVVKQREFKAMTFGSYKFNEVKEGDFCEAPLSLYARPVSGDETKKIARDDGWAALPLFVKQSEAAKKADDEVHSALNEIVTSIRNDEKRVADEMYAYWDTTMGAELESIKEAIFKAGQQFHHDAGYSGYIVDKSEAEALFTATSVIEGEKVFPSMVDQSKDPKRFGENGVQHTLSFKATAKDQEFGGVKPIKSHTALMWEDMIKKFGDGAQLLGELEQKVSELVTGQQSVLADQISYSSEAVNFLLKDDGFTFQNGQEDTLGGAKIETAIAERIVDLVRESTAVDHKAFTEFIKFPESDANQVSEMTKLTTSLSFLKLRKIGIEDAIKANLHFRTIVSQAIGELGESIRRKLVALKGKVERLRTPVYDQAKLIGVEIHGEGADEKNNFDYITALSNLVNGDNPNAIAEAPLLEKMIVNVLWRAHAHLLGFVQVAKTGEIVGAAQCLLYGRIDALLLRLELEDGKGIDEKVCTAIHNAGVKGMENVGEIGKSQPPSSNAGGAVRMSESNLVQDSSQLGVDGNSVPVIDRVNTGGLDQVHSGGGVFVDDQSGSDEELREQASSLDPRHRGNGVKDTDHGSIHSNDDGEERTDV